jgi:hypothetical protein
VENIVDLLPALLGIPADRFYTFLIILVTVANLVGRAIPDSATGVLGGVRKVAKIVGLYVGNRISPTVSANDVARAITATVPDAQINASADSLKDAVQTGVAAGNLAESIIDAANGRSAGEPYVPGLSPEPGSPVPDEYRTDGPFARGAAALSEK